VAGKKVDRWRSRTLIQGGTGLGVAAGLAALGALDFGRAPGRTASLRAAAESRLD
jgi:hypothetical protein